MTSENLGPKRRPSAERFFCVYQLFLQFKSLRQHMMVKRMCICKRIKALEDVVALPQMENLALPKMIRDKALGLITSLRNCHDDIESNFNDGVLEGYSQELENKFGQLYATASQRAIEAVGLENRSRPILKKSNKAEKAPKKRRPSAKAKAAAKAKVLWQNLVLPNPPKVMQSPDPEREVSSSGL